MLFDGSNILTRQKPGGGTAASRPTAKSRAKLALALGSGAARGWAHIGILKGLKRAGFEPDIIAGTSIGALVGGCHAAGALSALEDFALGLNRRRVFALLDIPWRGGGLIAGSKLTELLHEQLADTRIEQLHRPFAAVATELATGHEIWLNEGNLSQALRASYALPGIFPPVKIDGKWLIDGAVVNPIPVSVCRAMGARHVIAVNLNVDALGTGTVIQNPKRRTQRAKKSRSMKYLSQSSVRRFLTGNSDGPGISTTMIATYTISQDRLARSRMAGDPPDLVIAPKSADIGMFDFDKAKAGIAAGEEAVTRMRAELDTMLARIDGE